MKTNYPIRLAVETMRYIKFLSDRMGRERQDITREGLDLGLPIMNLPEYYALRLQGMTIDQIVSEIRKLFRALALQQHGNKKVVKKKVAGSAQPRSS